MATAGLRKMRRFPLIKGVLCLLLLLLFLLSLFNPSVLLSRSEASINSLRERLFSEGKRVDPTPCQRSLQFAPVPLPVTALASTQGSGNTWTRHLLQQLTGIYTGSVYDGQGDLELSREGYKGEGIANGSVVAVKTHGLTTSPFRRAVVVIRNPYDAVVADFNRRASESHTGVAPLPAYFHYWYAFSKEYARRWSVFHDRWARFQGPLLFLNFDDLVHSVEPTVQKLSAFFNHSSLTMDVQCTLDNRKGVAKRGKVSFDKREVFSKNLTRYINERVQEVAVILAHRFPELSAAVATWKRNESALGDLRFKPLPKHIF